MVPDVGRVLDAHGQDTGVRAKDSGRNTSRTGRSHPRGPERDAVQPDGRPIIHRAEPDDDLLAGPVVGHGDLAAVPDDAGILPQGRVGDLPR